MVGGMADLRLYQRSWWFHGVVVEELSKGLWKAYADQFPAVTALATTPGGAAARAQAQLAEEIGRSPGMDVFEVAIIVRARLLTVHRGCCDRCDRCGSPYTRPGEAGCLPGRCGQVPAPKLLKACPNCSRPYEAQRRDNTPDEQFDFRSVSEALETDPTWEWPVEEEGRRPRTTGPRRKWTADPRPAAIRFNKTLTRKEKRESKKLKVWMGRAPKTRAECDNVIRPCPFATCKYNLYLDVNPDTGGVRLNFPHLQIWQMRESCALDIAERGGVTLEGLGGVMNISLEGARQVELEVLEEARAKIDPEELEKLIMRGK